MIEDEVVEKFEKAESAKEVSFVIYHDDSIDALKELISAASYAFDPVTITIRRRDAEGKMEVTVNNVEAVVCECTIPIQRPRFLGDEWPKKICITVKAIVFRIYSHYFVVLNNKLYYVGSDQELNPDSPLIA
jgi:hypothetical protein